MRFHLLNQLHSEFIVAIMLYKKVWKGNIGSQKKFKKKKKTTNMIGRLFFFPSVLLVSVPL